jgi:hypothetical protein
MIERLRRSTARPAAPRRTRLALAYGYVGAVALASAAALGIRGTASAVVQLVALVAMATLWFALRRATRWAADAPDEALGELLARLRARAFVLAYQVLAALALVVAACLLALSDGGVGEPVVVALAWALFGSALGLPVVVTAVAVPDAGPPAAGGVGS